MGKTLAQKAEIEKIRQAEALIDSAPNYYTQDQIMAAESKLSRDIDSALKGKLDPEDFHDAGYKGPKKKLYIPKSIEPFKQGAKRDVKNLGRFTNRLLTGSLSVKDTTVYRGQTVKPEPLAIGGDFVERWKKAPIENQVELQKLSGKFWSGDRRVAIGYADEGRFGQRPLVVYKGEVKKREALKGLKGIFKQDRLLTRNISDNKEGDKSWRRTKISKNKQDLKHDARSQLRYGRKFKIYETVLEPNRIKNKRVDLGATYKVNPTFKDVKTQAIKTGLGNVARAGSRLLAPVAAGMFVHDVVKHGPLKAVQNLSPVPAYNPDDGYKGDTDPRKRKRKTLLGIN